MVARWITCHACYEITGMQRSHPQGAACPWCDLEERAAEFARKAKESGMDKLTPDSEPKSAIDIITADRDDWQRRAEQDYGWANFGRAMRVILVIVASTAFSIVVSYTICNAVSAFREAHEARAAAGAREAAAEARRGMPMSVFSDQPTLSQRAIPTYNGSPIVGLTTDATGALLVHIENDAPATHERDDANAKAIAICEPALTKCAGALERCIALTKTENDTLALCTEALKLEQREHHGP